MNNDIERRNYQLNELRLDGQEGAQPKIIGHAAVFDQLSENLGGFRERIARGAFAKTLLTADVRALFNHNINFVLGRSKSGTLRMTEDSTGLAIEIDPPDTTFSRDLQISMKRADIDQMSFGFRTIKDSWDEVGGEWIRTLLEVELLDVSPVTFPAYPQTDVAVRSMQQLITAKHKDDYRIGLMKRRMQVI
ncbi:HK97 family phage prohead protease [Nitrosomonas oligotropha]|uniref:HK97 family phage prohead protease n=1 Tax=Nitrosomonas oligotropha TaxID=42354 RepID=UPI0013697394|nr:HK97 family phage prohead protease [Nitrosomonas oligotropha]MXS81567.1 HK97 family phage prohead protease [Nitrosomonas oligotropha]